MKSLDELQKIRARVRDQVYMTDAESGHARVLVGMATCGIASGAGPVYERLSALIRERNLSDRINLTKTGCIGLCQYEPVVEVVAPGGSKVTYIRMTPAKVEEVVEKHLIGGRPVEEYTLNSVPDL